MTTYIDYIPSTQGPFTFDATLDGTVYSAVVSWNLFGVRTYLNLYALDGTLLKATAVVGSPDGVTLETLTWASGRALATASAPHGFKAGQTVNLTVTGVTPDGYNGEVQAFITGPSTFTYPIAANPGEASVLGAATANISLVAGMFDSTLVFRQSANQFEISP